MIRYTPFSLLLALLFPLLLTLLAVIHIPAHAKTPERPPVPVFITPVVQKSFVDEVEALGTLKAQHNVSLSSTVTELITAIHFTDGQRVKKGDLLVEMDAAEEQALAAEERSRIAEAKRQLERLRPLVARGASSKAVLDEQQLELHTSQARLRAIESQIRQREIIAPFDGVLGQRDISLGALLQPGTLITTLDDDSVMKLDFSVPDLFLPVLTPGASIKATARAWPNKEFTGSISSVNSRIDPLTRSVQVRALLDNASGQLRPGLLMRVMVHNHPRDAWVIPEEAIVVKGQQNSVFIVEMQDSSPIAKQVSVTIGARKKGEIEILEGLKANDQVVIHGALRLRTGTPVSVKAVENNNETLDVLLQQEQTP